MQNRRFRNTEEFGICLNLSVLFFKLLGTSCYQTQDLMYFFNPGKKMKNTIYNSPVPAPLKQHFWPLSRFFLIEIHFTEELAFSSLLWLQYDWHAIFLWFSIQFKVSQLLGCERLNYGLLPTFVSLHTCKWYNPPTMNH